MSDIGSEFNLENITSAELPKEYTLKRFQLLDIHRQLDPSDITEENKLQKAVVMNVGNVGEHEFTVWSIVNEAISPVAVSTTPIHAKFIQGDILTEQDITKLVENYYAGNQSRDLSALDGMTPEQKQKVLERLTPERIAEYKRKDKERVLTLVQKLAVETPPERTITDNEILSSWRDEQRKK